MNKKIFTLLVGALLSMTSLFTANAQVRFADTLRVNDVENVSSKDGAYYLLSVTGIANPVGVDAIDINAGANATPQQPYVLFVDSLGQLRIDTLSVIDFKYQNMGYKGSTKIGAIRHASWCVDYRVDKKDGSNVIFDFTNLESSRLLQAPLVSTLDSDWGTVTEDDGANRLFYKNDIDLVNDEDLIVSGWHFSQTSGTEALQKKMPLYSHVEQPGYVLVFTLDTTAATSIYTDPTTIPGTGGWRVTVKYVAIGDLIKDASGNVNIKGTDAKYVDNVLLFTLKKIDKFVLNEDDYNAVSTTINFNPDAKNEDKDNEGWNPFTTADNGGIDPHAKGPLTAFEVQDDSLYKFGYLQFMNEDDKWLYVDTAFLNYGNEEYLSFNWSDVRRDTTIAEAKWGILYFYNIFSDGYDYTQYPYNGSYKPDYATYSSSSTLEKFKQDSALWVASGDIKFLAARDSIIENQSKFRVVYDPYTDSTFINVYQTRLRYTDYKDPHNPVSYPWWKNSFIWDGATITNPAGGNVNHIVGTIDISAPKGMDTVLISTADTTIFTSTSLSHIYGWNPSANVTGSLRRDSLLYIDIQDLEKNLRIVTLDQSKNGNAKNLDTHIKLGFATRCEAESNEGKATIANDLYLIRNAKGEYLSVPLISLADSVYWVPVETWEDPTRMPSYQWVVENKRDGEGSPFRLTNREFENVSFDYVYVYANGDSLLKIGDPKYSGAKFAKEKFAVIRSGVIPTEKALGPGEFDKAKTFSTDEYSFLPLNAEVKGDQLLGYKYIDKDAAYIDVYAFKYYHFLATGTNAPYMGWNGYDDPKVDSVIYLNNRDYKDKLYFSLLEMPYENIGEDRVLVGYYPDGTKQKDLDDYKSIYDQYGTKANLYMNSDSIVLENFGYMPAKLNAKGEKVYDYSIVKDLKPLARQAYRLLLKDYYKYYMNPYRGDYLTLGGQDNYILSDNVNASKPYVQTSGRAEGVFGIPYFYFRNTYFGIPGANAGGNAVNEDYFALVQRLDTVSTAWGGSNYADVEDYLTIQFGSAVATNITKQIRGSRELGAFIATIDADKSTKMKIAVRGDITVSPSTFTLERDEDPLYRRFHWNDKFEKTYEDKPLVLEFHRLNDETEYRLFENTGADKSSGGGYEYNLNKQGVLHKDSLGNVISFLGVKNISQFKPITKTDDPHENTKTNYAFYVDTAYINRGTGWIKPQYMLAVDVKEVEPCVDCGEEFEGYTIGRYLFNTSMYAKEVVPGTVDGGVVNYDLTQPINTTKYHAPINGVSGSVYTQSGTTEWERLAFAWAIHRDDKLYVLKNLEPSFLQGKKYDTEDVIKKLVSDYPGGKKGENVDFSKLIKTKGLSKAELGNKIGVHAIIDLGDNTHKDWVFSFRYVQRGSDDFIIESETTERNRIGGPVIRPTIGGWVKYQGGVPTITRTDTKTLLGEGLVVNVGRTEVEPVGNDEVGTTSDVKVVGGYGAVTVLNAAGKSIAITNVIGQTLTNTIADSDNVSVAVAAKNTIVFVSVDGGVAVKALVK